MMHCKNALLPLWQSPQLNVQPCLFTCWSQEIWSSSGC